MKYITLLFLLTFISISCLSQNQSESDFKKLDWLVGKWDRTNISKSGRTAHEVWKKISDNRLGGYGVVIQNQDTVFIEKFELVTKEDGIYYVADVPENNAAVYFKVTELSTRGFTCENMKHDFPKKITYQWDGFILKAQISGDGKSSDFLFKKESN